jgi:hypothetical protein
MNKFLPQLYPHILLHFISFQLIFSSRKQVFHVGPNFFPGGRIFMIIWTEGFEKSWQHWYQHKGRVSRDWAGLQMGSLDRSEFPTILLEVYF